MRINLWNIRRRGGIAAKALITGVAAFLCAALPADADAISIAKVTGGIVEGTASDTPGVSEFRGIPYGGNVGGDHAWEPTPPVEPWEGIRKADAWGDQMLQDSSPGQGEPTASFDGLNLTVWTPAESNDEKIPVYMLIHGGANRLGSSAMRDIYAAELASQGIVVVSVQYRLGAQGFMALPEMAHNSPNGAKGNFAVLDLISALQWIRDNIAQFGGDPATVTIGGQSAGGENAVALLRTPLAKGMFKRAFIQSSFTGFLPGKVEEFGSKARHDQAEIDKLFGKPTTLDDLRSIDQRTWLAPWNGEEASLYSLLARATGGGQFYTVDGHVFTDDSVDLLEPGDFEGLDIVIGQTADEYTGLRKVSPMTPEEQREALLSFVREYQVGQVDEAVLPLYASDDPIEASRLALRAINDYMFQYVRLGAEIAKRNSKGANVYLYYWDHWPPGKDQGLKRAYHAADLWFWNGSIRAGARDQKPWTDPDLAMKQMAMTYLANFVKTGDPNGNSVPHWDQVGDGASEAAGQFLRLHEGSAEMRDSTVYPSRDAYMRRVIVEGMAAQRLNHHTSP
ncbi:carboxylesterase family protein [Pseudorhizobium pelagicum]|uniref:carboxylesterase family protein n=1 Tax=Pseudorhizobium pelagicum TaxID=1509405 RepID=UPI00068A6C4D|nr:carboxylesterase family protein [Pseudorhizobium pelagicum]